MNKKLLTALAGGAALTFGMAGILLVAGDSLKAAIAEEETHAHTATCNIHHYNEVAPTSSTAGVKEYWICCDDPGHKVSFTAPTTGNISDATHVEGFAVEDTDERYIAPYTFPEVFKTKYAYSDGVTFADGKVTAASGSLYFKGSVLREAYSLGYTHMRFHSKAEGDEAVQVLGTQDNWKNYYKRYANDNDNRYWLKSFSDNNAGLLVQGKNSSDVLVASSLTLSDFHLYKSSITESWGNGTKTGGYQLIQDANKYVAFEDGELVADNCGAGKYALAIEIPTSLIGSTQFEGNGTWWREFCVKKLASGIETPDGEDSLVINGKSEDERPYYFVNSDGNQRISSDGFISPCYNHTNDKYGLYINQYNIGSLSIGWPTSAAYALRINYDFLVDNGDKTAGIEYLLNPLARTADGMDQIELLNITAPATEHRLPIVMRYSDQHKGVKLNFVSSVEPASNMGVMNIGRKAWQSFPKFTKNEDDGLYYSSVTINYTDEKIGAALILRWAEAVTNGTFKIQYSWVD